MIVYIWAVSGNLFLFQQEEHRLLMNDWKHCTGFVAKIMKVPTRVFHTCRSCMSLHTSCLLSEWVTLNIAWPGSMTTCRSIQAKDRDLSGDWRWDIVPKISQNSIDRLTNVFRASGSLFSDKSILSIKNQTWFLFCLCCVLVWNPRKQCPRAGTMCPVDREQGRVTLQKQLILWVMSCWIRITLGWALPPDKQVLWLA
jgi:hypothetical protein